MATRDKSQGFGFVYMNLAALLSKKEWAEEGPELQPQGAKILNFNRDTLFPVEKPAVATPAPEAPRTPVEQIRENLDRLQTLHHRIHVMLEELNQLNGKKKKGD